MSEVPIVLVHGGGHGAWCWEPMLPFLTAPTIAVDLPPVSIRGGPARNVLPPGSEALTLADFADAVFAAIDGAGIDRFVLVGHSLAGLTISEVARRAPERVAHLVFVSALVPRQGETGLDAMEPDIMESVDSGLTGATIEQMFCNDMDAEQTQFVLDHVGSDVVQVMTAPVDRRGTPSCVPTTYVRLSRDQALTLSAQARSIAALEAVPGAAVNVVELDSGHNAMISNPADLAAVINTLTAQTP